MRIATPKTHPAWTTDVQLLEASASFGARARALVEALPAGTAAVRVIDAERGTCLTDGPVPVAEAAWHAERWLRAGAPVRLDPAEV